MRHGRTRTGLALLALSGVLAGCGSTVQQQGLAGNGVPAAGTDGLGGVAPPGTDGSSPPAPDSVALGTGSAEGLTGTAGSPAVDEPGVAVAGNAASGGAAAGSGGAGGAPAPGAAGAGQGPRRLGPGITSKVIRVGAVYADNGDEVNKAAGIEGVTNGDTKREYELLRDDINRRGGIAGRKIELELVNIDATSAEDGETRLAALCETFTRDKPVFAVIQSGSDAYRACIRKGGAVQVHNTVSEEDDTALRLAPSFAFPHGISLTRVARAQTDQLLKVGFFDKGAKNGLVTFDSASFKRAALQELEPGMKRRGLTLDEKVFVPPLRNNAGYSEVSAAISSAVLRFRQEGITHVQFLQSTGDLSLFFMQAAESQGYRPRYGLNGQDAGQGLIGGGLVPAAQGKNAVGFGWYPLFDVPVAEARTSYNSTSKRCLKIFTDGGLSFPDYNSEIVALFQCDAFLFLERTLKASAALNQSAFAQAIAGTGQNYQAGSTFATSFGPGRTDGVAKVRPFKFFEDCTCFRYTGPTSDI